MIFPVQLGPFSCELGRVIKSFQGCFVLTHAAGVGVDLQVHDPDPAVTRFTAAGLHRIIFPDLPLQPVIPVDPGDVQPVMVKLVALLVGPPGDGLRAVLTLSNVLPTVKIISYLRFFSLISNTSIQIRFVHP